MTIRYFFALLFLVVFLQSCSLLNFKKCGKYKTNEYSLQSSATARNANMEIAYNKALFDANKILIKEIDNYIIDKLSFKKFLKNPDYETKLDIIRTETIKEINVVCKYVKIRKKYNQVTLAIEIPKSKIDEIFRLNKVN